MYLFNPPILQHVDHGNPLYLYVSTTNHALGVVLVQKDDTSKERVMYYLSKTLHDTETKYTLIEKLCYVIIHTAKKLRHYMITNTTFIVTQVDPLRYFLSKP